jgi:hypothetical protein
MFFGQWGGTRQAWPSDLWFLKTETTSMTALGMLLCGSIRENWRASVLKSSWKAFFDDRLKFVSFQPKSKQEV